MDTRRLIIFIALSFGILFLWQEWEKARHPEKFKPQTEQAASAPNAAAPAAKPAVNAAPANTPADAGKLQSAGRIKVDTDLVQAEIDTMGGDLRQLKLKKHGVQGKPGEPFTLLQEGPEHLYVAQTGLLSANQPALPTHKTVFTSAQTSASLKDGEASVSVRLEAPDAGGVKVAKVYTFHRGSYLVDVKYEVTNTGTAPLPLSAYFRLLRDDKEPEGSSQYFGATSFTGPAVYTAANKFQKATFEEIQKNKATYAKTTGDGWVAMLQHYFATAWVLTPADKASICANATACQFELKQVSGNLYSAGALVNLAALNAGEKREFTVPLFAGPEETRVLKQVAEGFDLVKDYGWLTIIASPLFWVLDKLHAVVGNWGWAIILLTVLIKLVFFPLSAASYRSMAHMKEMAPRMQRLKEQFGDDRAKYQQAMMDMYKTEKINPLGGCLPMLVQIPVFMALYWALLASVELRQAPWLGWIHDLSVQDPYYILPVLMAISMIAQSFMNPPAADPMQDKMMKIMPVVFSVMFIFFPAGLVLYWVVNNVLSIAQQWYITQSMKKDKAQQEATHR